MQINIKYERIRDSSITEHCYQQWIEDTESTKKDSYFLIDLGIILSSSYPSKYMETVTNKKKIHPAYLSCQRILKKKKFTFELILYKIHCLIAVPAIWFRTLIKQWLIFCSLLRADLYVEFFRVLSPTLLNTFSNDLEEEETNYTLSKSVEDSKLCGFVCVYLCMQSICMRAQLPSRGT